MVPLSHPSLSMDAVFGYNSGRVFRFQFPKEDFGFRRD
ncbi:hypothetical protein N181_23685 [Sinorhizobium fredii USDA 205]|nr:hypothetical protein SF83666_b59940 [Sinorhizobium fredii CCBAU 83666]AWI60568.1 hypothetical protein AB395_00005391 [Sinorhizobium fredii CCBAU 45436]AWM28784.1 hypothetical protein AOX55_00006009 [Sinorhizobium fredii CCBAU 25509]KSV85379.1 hypothetical protein N181_23685 [Sinorhizobium fredii USDA 205]